MKSRWFATRPVHAMALAALAALVACGGEGGSARSGAHTDALATPSRTYAYDALGLPAGTGAPPARDGLGRALGHGGATLTWGADGQLAAVVSAAGRRTEYIHDEAGQRIAWRQDGAVVAVDVEGVHVDARGVEQLFFVGAGPVGRFHDGHFALLPLDRRGSALGHDASDGAPGHGPTLASPYGERVARPFFAALIDFAGASADPALGTVRMGVRDFDPDTQVFLSPDPLFLEHPEKCVESPVECSLYGYARNQPVDHIDPEGTESKPIYGSEGKHADARPLPGIGWAPNPFGATPMDFALSRSRARSELGYAYTTRDVVGFSREGLTPREAMATLQRSPNGIFPFDVVPRDGGAATIRLGAEYSLNHARFPGDYGNGVRVIEMTETSFTFLTLPDHFDGPGATITFNTGVDDQGRVYLEHVADAPHASPFNSVVAPLGAVYLTWPQQARNLRMHLIKSGGIRGWR